ncbi:NADH dehydrogenase FAD-containing subunit, partial [Myxococcota bacterium]|nr:NADH dehydrogenase FAD-containing subunit [Myxococcota bacterium]
MIAALLLVPLVAAALVWRLGRPGWNCPIVLAVAVLHAAFTGSFWVDDPAPLLDGWIGLDAVGRWFLTATSVLNLATAAYTIGYLGRDRRGDEPRSRA